ncbi:hypothetical protein D3C86_1704140 [compost metagenome]
MVRMWTSLVVLMNSTMAASVVDLPEPVGPVTSTRPWRSRASFLMTGGRSMPSTTGGLSGMTRKAAPMLPCSK